MMKIRCEDANITTSTFHRELIVDLTNVDFYDLYMENNLDELLKEIPASEIREHLEKRKEEEDD